MNLLGSVNGYVSSRRVHVSLAGLDRAVRKEITLPEAEILQPITIRSS